LFFDMIVILHGCMQSVVALPRHMIVCRRH
jgi:hypothetical protein